MVEALLEGRRAIGLDTDPLALRISQAKTISMRINDLRGLSYNIVSQAQELLTNNSVEKFLQNFDGHTKEFIDGWLYPNT